MIGGRIYYQQKLSQSIANQINVKGSNDFTLKR
jgi:hypothetical protein